jgi:uncharacterized protein
MFSPGMHQLSHLMSGLVNLDELLAAMAPVLRDGEFVCVTFPDGSYGAHANLHPIAAFSEREGLALIVPRDQAAAAGLSFDVVLRMITLNVHSSLAAVGLTAAVARTLTERGISANVVAAFYHDHVFVPADRAQDALLALDLLSREAAK